MLILRWAETGGPSIDVVPATSGFGSTLVSQSVTQQLDGSLHYDWQPEGLVLQMDTPLRMLVD